MEDNTDDYDKTVVITHRQWPLPSYHLILDRYRGHYLNCFFASHLDDLVELADIWGCGHSHNFNMVQIGQCKCYINPGGYSDDQTDYITNHIIDC